MRQLRQGHITILTSVHRKAHQPQVRFLIVSAILRLHRHNQYGGILTASQLDISQSSSIVSLWVVRLLLAGLLLLGNEVLLWNNPQTHHPLEWLLRIVAYVISATLLLDLAVRYRIRNVYDVMTLIVVHVMLVVLLIQPDVAFDEFPSKFIQRMMGAVGFVSMEVLGMFFLMTRASTKRGRFLMIFYAIAVGFYWGVWSAFAPLREVNDIQPVPFNIMIAFFCIVGLIVFLLFLHMSRLHSVWRADDLKLSERELGTVAIIVLVLLFIRFAQGLLAFGGMTVAIVLLMLAVGILYYRKPEKAQMLMDNHFPPQPLKWVWVIIAGVIVCVSAFVSYHLPFIELDFFNQLWILELAFLGIGGIWLPMIAVVFSTEAIDRQSRTV